MRLQVAYECGPGGRACERGRRRRAAARAMCHVHALRMVTAVAQSLCLRLRCARGMVRWSCRCTTELQCTVMRLGLAKRITLEHIEPIRRSAGALGRRGAPEKRDAQCFVTSSNNLKTREVRDTATTSTPRRRRRRLGIVERGAAVQTASKNSKAVEHSCCERAVHSCVVGAVQAMSVRCWRMMS